MYLTKKGLKKVLTISICYFLAGATFIVAWFAFNNVGVIEDSVLVIGIVLLLLSVLLGFVGCYSEGTGKLINLGNKLVRNELKPAEFIKHYVDLKNRDDLVIQKPNIDVLRIVLLAYDLLNDKENALAMANEMIENASVKKQNLAKLLKSSLLFSYGHTQEAETLFYETRKQKLSIVCVGIADTIIKSDRAMATGDYKTAEVYYLNSLTRAFPKPDKIETIVSNYWLGEIYYKLNDIDKAIKHYKYCSDFGGETAIKISADEKLVDIIK